MPRNLALLPALRVLKGFVVSDKWKSCSLGELAGLKKLEKLGIIINTKEFKVEEWETELSMFQKLMKLKMAWGGRPLVGQEVKKKSLRGSGAEESKKGQEEKKNKKKNKSLEGNGEEQSKKEGKQNGALGNKGGGDSKKTEEKKEGGENNEASKEETKPENKQKEEDGGNHRAVVNDVKSLPGKKQNGNRRVVTHDHLVKLDLESFPDKELPEWMGPKFFKKLKKLYIRGGNIKSLDNVLEGEEKWEKVEILRLKYLNDLKMDWKQILDLFPNLWYLEKVKCPKITLCPCDGNGVWIDHEKRKRMIVPEKEGNSTNAEVGNTKTTN